jgi:hypothetical protein
MALRSSGIYGGKGGPDCPVIRNGEEELCGINNKLSLSAKLKRLKGKIMYKVLYRVIHKSVNHFKNS